MKTLHVWFLLLTLLTLIAGGCTPQPPAKAQADFAATYTLTTMMKDGKMAFVGVGGEIDGATNPDLKAQPGDRIRVTLINGDGMPHDLAIPELDVQSSMVTAKGQTADVVFEISATGEFAYYCTISGHRQAGMEGRLIVSKP
jgi:nitrite reductase (NO-forming)